MEEKITTIETEVPETVLLRAEPLQGQERMEILDVIRGFALLGILIVNMAMFSNPLYFEFFSRSNMWTNFGIDMQANFWNAATSGFINFFAQGKFYTIFAFLFGLGFFIFFERAKAKTTKPTLLFYKRLLILLLIGLIHAFFIWYGDVLVSYALFGLLLPLFFNARPKTILIWAGAIFFALVIFATLGLLAIRADENISASLMGEWQVFLADLKVLVANSFQAYGSGTFAEIQAQRTSDTLFMYQHILLNSIFIIFPLFLLGLYVGKKGIFQNIEANLPMIKKVWVWGLIVGLTLSTIKLILKDPILTNPYSFYAMIHTVAGFFGDLGLALFFMASLVLLYQNRKWFLRLKPLSYMGRMALSNYLFQSIVCIFIFYNFGLGLYGQVGTALSLALAIFIFIVQIFISRLWLKHYQYGPVEWLWKSLTYGKFFKMRNN